MILIFAGEQLTSVSAVWVMLIMKSLEGFGIYRTLLCGVYANLELGSSPRSPIIPFLSVIKSDDIAESHLTLSWRLRLPVYYLLIIECAVCQPPFGSRCWRFNWANVVSKNARERHAFMIRPLIEFIGALTTCEILIHCQNLRKGREAWKAGFLNLFTEPRHISSSRHSLFVQ